MISLIGVAGIPEVAPGDDLAALIAAALAAAGIGLADDDVLVVTQKVVSKAEGRARRRGNGPSDGARTPARWSLCCVRAARCCAWPRAA
jgi:coenzyme F420-0:L-glutamate ligase/coenzyme F420-1:gamma-L-glutamate ligase